MIGWEEDNSNIYSVKSAYNVINDESVGDEEFPIKKLRNKIILTKVSMFVWQVMQNCIPPKHSLCRRGIIGREELHCIGGCVETETSNNLCFACPTVSKMYCSELRIGWEYMWCFTIYVPSTLLPLQGWLAWRKMQFRDLKPFGSRVCGAFGRREMQGFFIIRIGYWIDCRQCQAFIIELVENKVVKVYVWIEPVVVEPASMLRGIRGCLFLLNMCIIGSGFVSGEWLRCFELSVCRDAVVVFCYCWFVNYILSQLFLLIPFQLYPSIFCPLQ